MKQVGKRIYRQIGMVALFFCLAMVGVFAGKSSVQAAEIDYLYKSGTQDATQGVDNNAEFSVKRVTETYVAVYTYEKANVNVVIKNSSNSVIGSKQILSSDTSWYKEGDVYYTVFSVDVTKTGDYTVSIQFPTSNETYALTVFQFKQPATISNSKIVLTKGFSKTLKVSNATGKITWKSSNKKIATVNSKGKVVAKKPGTCTISATTANKQKLTCKVSVKKNVYTMPSYTNSSLSYGKVSGYAKQMSYDSKGNLKIQYRIINNSGYNIVALKNITINVKTLSGKKIGTYKVAKKNISISNNSYKTFTVTIKKSKLKIKKADLRSNTTENYSGGSYIYRRY